jgi:hypothetical protein
MTRAPIAHNHLSVIQSESRPQESPIGLLEFSTLLGIAATASSDWPAKLPFGPSDATAGTETELQVAVTGSRDDVDLPRRIEQSAFYKNIVKRTATGDAPSQLRDALETYLASSGEIWENSWVRFPRERLNEFAGHVFHRDLLADKRLLHGPRRRDAQSFVQEERGCSYVRIPISYLLKLSLAQAIGRPGVPAMVRDTGEHMMTCFVNDNCSPETHSFHPVACSREDSLGKSIAKETALRYLLTQLLANYANGVLGLSACGQHVSVYFAPHPPVRQKQLNNLISDAFYRELFMSPCLSGWDQGEAKHAYMALCHQVLSRSQLNAVAKLKEAGIIMNNLVVLPNTSNICLANNGIHLSLGSRRLSRFLADPAIAYGAADEKYYGDLVIKISEHFLPLFVGTYSAAPYRFDFWDLHPERALGFLPHELDYTHLRMIWRRWKQKAAIKFLGHPVTPFGPEWLDRAISRCLQLKGDFVPDFRLIDYLVAVLSTDESPALDGRMGNDQRLKNDLAAMGTFDTHMPLYLLHRLRHYHQMGFSGYEARFFSLFERFGDDMGPAVDLQRLVVLLAYKYILQHRTSHHDIPDTPTVESERRQVFFGAAIGIPTFYVSKNSPNRLMAAIVKQTRHVRNSRRYPGYMRIPAVEYQRALIRVLYEDGRDLIEMMGLQNTLTDLERRIDDPENHAAARRLTRDIIGGKRPDPMGLSGEAFNRRVEIYYRDTLKRNHLKESYGYFKAAVGRIDSLQSWRGGYFNQPLLKLLNGKNAEDFLAAAEQTALNESLSTETCETLIYLMLLVFHNVKQTAGD